MFKRNLISLLAFAFVLSAPAYASDTPEIMTEDQFYSVNHDHPAFIEPAAGADVSIEASDYQILTEDQFYSNGPTETENVDVTDTVAPSIYSEHDY